MRRNASTVVVLLGRQNPVPAEVLAALGRSMNVALVRPHDVGHDDPEGTEAAAEALRQAGRSTSPYALVPADPLAAVAASWQAMWDVSRTDGPAGFETEALKAVTAWRSGRFELPDYYLILGSGTMGDDQAPDFYLGPLRSARPQRVAVAAATEPAHQAVAVLEVLGSLPYGPWWPDLDELIQAARTFYPGQLAAANPG